MDHIDAMLQKASLVTAWILRAIALRSPSNCITLNEAYVLPIVLYDQANRFGVYSGQTDMEILCFIYIDRFHVKQDQ